MAQRSLPQAGDGVGDAGPYTSDEWAEYFQITYTGDEQATQGPLKRYLNELEVTKAGLTITTLNGAGFVYGHFLVVDPAIGITIALAAAGQERYDRVVMVENNTNAAYNTNLALPAAYAAGIPRNSARIAILQGAEAGAAVLPVLLTGPNYYMVELARYLVTDAAVGDIDDRREFCTYSSHINTREDFVTPYLSYNSTAGTSPLGCLNNFYGLQMLDEADSVAAGAWIIPSNWDGSDITVTAVVYPAASGNVYSSNQTLTGACTEQPDTHVTSSAISAISITIAVNNCIQSRTVANRDIGDIVTLKYARHATHVSDTIGTSVAFRGWIVSYGVH